jgi:hypothetical protein
MLRRGLEGTPIVEDAPTLVADHENLRGPGYYLN